MRYVIASQLPQEAINKLQQNNISVIQPPDNASVSPPIRHHADISFLYDGDATVFMAKEMAPIESVLKKLGLCVYTLPHALGENYPMDCALNCVPLGKYLICNIDTVSPLVLQYFQNKGRTVISVRQGYTKCSVIPVRDRAVITDDASIASACAAVGLDTLMVSKGSVALNGFDYGLIGGAAGVINKNTVAFNGDITTHSDAAEILKFLHKYNMEALSLSPDQLTDIGSILPLYQEV